MQSQTGIELRAALLPFVLGSSPSGRRAVAEFWLPGSNMRADLVLLGEGMHGYEIKSRNDRLNRLPRQALAYGRLFDRCTAVVHVKHLAHTSEIVPAWWGLIEVSDRGDLRVVREAERNRAADSQTVVQLLWKEEARQLLVRLGCAVSADESRVGMWLRLLALVDLGYLHGLVGEVLARRDWTAARFGSYELRRRIESQTEALAAS